MTSAIRLILILIVFISIARSENDSAESRSDLAAGSSDTTEIILDLQPALPAQSKPVPEIVNKSLVAKGVPAVSKQPDLNINHSIPPEKAIHRISSVFSGIRIVAMKYGIRVFILIFSFIVIIATIAFYRRRVERERFMTTTRLSIMDKEVQKACRFIETNFANPDLGPRDICSELVTGEAFLQAIFERDLGMQVEDFITQVRINRVKILLDKMPELGKAEIAAQAGFRDTVVLDHTFIRLTGITFEEYKESLDNTRTPA